MQIKKQAERYTEKYLVFYQNHLKFKMFKYILLQFTSERDLFILVHHNHVMIKPDPEVYLPTSVAMFNVSWVCFVYEVVIGAHEILCGKYLRLS